MYCAMLSINRQSSRGYIAITFIETALSLSYRTSASKAEWKRNRRCLDGRGRVEKIGDLRRRRRRIVSTDRLGSI